MSLSDRPKLTPATTARRFRIDELRGAMPAEDAVIMDAYLIDPSLSADKISAELVAAGYSVSVGAVAAYRFRVLSIGKRAR